RNYYIFCTDGGSVQSERHASKKISKYVSKVHLLKLFGR
ncbi:MAG: hypothetical protein ACI9GB_003803, partial [Halioglobus sp.]